MFEIDYENLSEGVGSEEASEAEAAEGLQDQETEKNPESSSKGESVSGEPPVYRSVMEEEDMVRLSRIKDILGLSEESYPEFVLAKNKARFRKKLVWYRAKQDWLDIAPFNKINKLFKQQTKELEGIRSSKLDYEMELETGSLTPSQRAYRKDELKMCRVHEKMAIQLISKIQMKFRIQSR